MDFIRTDQDLLYKIAGNVPVTYRSSDYASLASGSTQTITFPRETSSILLHNRSTYDSNNTIYFYLNGITSAPVALDPGENVSLNKAWVTEVIIQPNVSGPVWQIIATL